MAKIQLFGPQTTWKVESNCDHYSETFHLQAVANVVPICFRIRPLRGTASDNSKSDQRPKWAEYQKYELCSNRLKILCHQLLDLGLGLTSRRNLNPFGYGKCIFRQSRDFSFQIFWGNMPPRFPTEAWTHGKKISQPFIVCKSPGKIERRRLCYFNSHVILFPELWVLVTVAIRYSVLGTTPVI